MKKGDIFCLGILALIIGLLSYPSTHSQFVMLTKVYPYTMGFIKVAILATIGELIAVRIATGNWHKPVGLRYRFLVWGLLGISFVTVFELFASGVAGAVQKHLLPVAGTGYVQKVSVAFWISTTMNLIFAPTMMALHRITDTYIELSDGRIANLRRIELGAVVAKIDWTCFVQFVVVKTIPLFWIPAHMVTFMLLPEYRVLMAAMLSIALGGILASAKRKSATG
jgi:hypothetical protein